ncbi:hypothetical protein PsorP6_013520 [Peronosclerospora sorghi]|uniref:Uncharacterized protein n=1 Tax=Peronosclerospora sorghi TaxID=230839 RepID=A0ACC0VGL6_9STRA|nr:hypothetical protein PsorP6_013520 [Peronosclerospora sorghi]
MTKLPLETCPFPPLHLVDSDHETLVNLAEVIVTEAIEDYERHLRYHAGRVDPAAWARVKKVDDILVYQDREALKERRLSRVNLSRTTKQREILHLLWLGTIRSELEDIMYAVVDRTTEEAKLKAASIESTILDVAVLASPVHPTTEFPFRGLQVKWAVKNAGPLMMRSIVRCRDFIYLESTGVTTLSTGERVGYQLLHSISLPGAPELHDFKFVRGNMTLYHLFRQKSAGVVETYVKAFLDYMGDMPLRIATTLATSRVVSVSKLGEYALLKKLHWLLTQRRDILPTNRSNLCLVCLVMMQGSLKRQRTCKICMNRCCLRCCVPQKMYFVRLHSRVVVRTDAHVCKKCIQTASSKSSVDIIKDDVSQPNNHLKTYKYWSTVSPSSSTSSRGTTMKLPLFTCPFKPLELSDSEQDMIRSTADSILIDTMTDYDRLLLHENGVVDTERWKLLKRKENLAAYQDRCALAVTLRASKSIEFKSPQDPITPRSAPSLRASTQRVLWHGTINCDLDDLMLGVLTPNADTWKVKASYLNDSGLDYFLLATIKERTTEHPFDGLEIKWTLNDMGPGMAKPLVSPRDFVFLESTGITYSPKTGERIGYHICKSIDVPGIPELSKYKVVRGRLELYHIFRQKSHGVVEVYVRALCDLQGGMPFSSISVFSMEAIPTLSLVALCGERHKVMWMLQTMETREKDDLALSVCTVCSKDLSKTFLTFMIKTCRLCSGRICSGCRIPKKMNFLDRRTPEVIKKIIDLCTRCAHLCARVSALQVAQEEISLGNPTSFFYQDEGDRSGSCTVSMSSGGGDVTDLGSDTHNSSF